MSNPPHKQITTIGYALAPKKEQTFIQPSLVSYAIQHGVVLLKIDTNKPLINQGPFDGIIHKMYGQDWKNQLQLFSSQNPNAPIIDSLDSINKLHNRISMLDVVNNLKIRVVFNEKLGIPNQVIVLDGEITFSSNDKLGFPLLAKPLVADGTANSHQMYLVFDNEGLSKLTAPIVLQEFVNHGGVIFKVYVVGESVKCVKRRSLPDISEEKLRTLKGSLSFSQISNLSAQEEGGESEEVDRGEMPRLEFIEEVAKAMREALGLNLFNFDVIRDGKDENRYLVIDINYFPGYAKMPGFESVLTDFFLDVVKKKKNDNEGCGVEESNNASEE